MRNNGLNSHFLFAQTFFFFFPLYSELPSDTSWKETGVSVWRGTGIRPRVVGGKCHLPGAVPRNGPRLLPATCSFVAF